MPDCRIVPRVEEIEGDRSIADLRVAADLDLVVIGVAVKVDDDIRAVRIDLEVSADLGVRDVFVTRHQRTIDLDITIHHPAGDIQRTAAEDDDLGRPAGTWATFQEVAGETHVQRSAVADTDQTDTLVADVNHGTVFSYVEACGSGDLENALTG